MEVQPDFRDLLASLNAHDVAYIVVGGYALAWHGAPRFTGDIDLFVKCDPSNARRIMSALDEFGFGSVGIASADFEQPERVVQLGVPPVRVDLITSISGVTWREAERGKIAGTYGDVPVFYIGRRELATNKRAVGRQKDLADLEALGEE